MKVPTLLIIILPLLLVVAAGIFYLMRQNTAPSGGLNNFSDLPTNQSYEKFELRGTSNPPPAGISGTSADYPAYVSFEYPSEFEKESKRSLCNRQNQTCIQVQMANFDYSAAVPLQEWYAEHYDTKITPQPITAARRQALYTTALVTVPAFESKPSELSFVATLYVPTKKGVITFKVIPFVEATNPDNQDYATAVLHHIAETLVLEDAS